MSYWCVFPSCFMAAVPPVGCVSPGWYLHGMMCWCELEESLYINCLGGWWTRDVARHSGYPETLLSMVQQDK